MSTMNIEELSANWTELGKKLGLTKNQVHEQWQNWQSHYQAKGRAYHNLTHIGAMLGELTQWPHKPRDKTSMQLAIWFHDYIYQATRKDNEAKSAEMAVGFLRQWQYPSEKITKIEAMILATAGHKDAGLDEDGRIFLDLDLAILGQDRKRYAEYIAAIRREYRIYPGFLYRKGRQQVLQHFLEREKLYFTATGREKWEEPARENLIWELDRLT
jgi:predicted metal-dependent HD superfamily phosphohydrolase